MNYLLVHHHADDFAKWKIAYDAHSGVRQKAGLKEVSLLHGQNDENDVTLLFEANNLDKAKAFATSTELKDTMQKAGVVGKPEISILKD